MFTNHRGTNTLEWVVGAAAVILLIGAIIFTIATKTNGEGASTGNWIDSVNVPSTHP